MKSMTERLGLSALEYYFSERGWLFREQMTHDYGIDAHVEIFNGNYPTGKIIAIQIKSGESFFKEEKSDYFVFRTEYKHANYWSDHSLPVILVLYNPEIKELFWQVVNEETLVSTGKNWKIEVPKLNKLNEHSFSRLEALTQPDSYLGKLNKLRLDKEWMIKVHDDAEVFVEFDDWINKSLPRFEVRLLCDGDRYSWPLTFGPGLSIEETLDYFIPWANFEMDYEAHEDAAEADWMAECYMGKDKETGEIYYLEKFHDWYKRPDEIVPIECNGETELYRLRLTLNEVGKSFLEIDSHLSEESDFETKTFNLDDLHNE